MQTDAHLGYEQSKRRRLPRRTVAVVVAMLLAYPAGYCVLRATHVIVHYQDMEGGIVAPAVGTRIPGLSLLKPLMRLEDKFWYRGDRTPG